MFELLRQLRLTIAREEGMPPYIVFSDKSLIDMSVKAPRNRSSMLAVSGVGEAKYEKYGERFIEAITAFMDENPESVTSIKDDEAADTLISEVQSNPAFGSYGTESFGEDAYPRPAAVFVNYTGLSEVYGNEPPTYSAVGTNDGIASYRTMERRINAIQTNGTDA